jgi:hypothetical protein
MFNIYHQSSPETTALVPLKDKNNKIIIKKKEAFCFSIELTKLNEKDADDSR